MLKNQRGILTILFTTLFYVFLFVFLLNNSFSYLDPDLGWHLRVGREAINEKSVPSINYFNYTIENVTWVDHEWLIDAFSYLVYDKLGYVALNLFFVLLVIFVVALLHLFIYKNFSKNKQAGHYLFAFFALFGVWGMSPHLGVRVQEIALLNIALLIFILYYFSKNKKLWPLFFLPPLIYFWSMVHGSFLIGLFVIFFFAGFKLFEYLIFKKYETAFLIREKILRPVDNVKLSFFALLSFVVTLFTPYGLKLYSFLSGYTDTYYMNYIEEWLGQYYYPFNYPQLLYLAFAASLILIILITFISKKRADLKVDWWLVALSIFFLALSFKSRRHFPLFFVVSLPVLFSFFEYIFKFPDERKFQYFSNALKIILAGFFISGIFWQSQDLKIIQKPFAGYCFTYPCEAVRYLKENEEYKDKKIFNKYGWGGYLIWTWPEKKLFIDGRLPQVKYKGHTILEEYHQFFKEGKTGGKLNEYDIDFVLTAKDRPRKVDWFAGTFFNIKKEDLNKKSEFKKFLETSSAWELDYEDKTSLIYVRKKN